MPRHALWLFYLSTGTLTFSAQAAISVCERLQLSDIYSSTSGNTWTHNDNWCAGGPCPMSGTTTLNATGTECAWYGVECDAAKTHIVKINLHANNLSGSWPLLYGGACTPSLQQFDVRDNHLTGSLSSINSLTALSQFDASGNALIGSIPSLTGLTNLSDFRASKNQLTGSIPSLSGLINLADFLVGDNKLTGSIPSLSGLTSLRFFYVYHNQLTGPIPWLAGLASLHYFAADHNQLTGSIPSLTDLPNLSYLGVDHNQLT